MSLAVKLIVIFTVAVVVVVGAVIVVVAARDLVMLPIKMSKYQLVYSE